MVSVPELPADWPTHNSPLTLNVAVPLIVAVPLPALASPPLKAAPPIDVVPAFKIPVPLRSSVELTAAVKLPEPTEKFWLFVFADVEPSVVRTGASHGHVTAAQGVAGQGSTRAGSVRQVVGSRRYPAPDSHPVAHTRACRAGGVNQPTVAGGAY